MWSSLQEPHVHQTQDLGDAVALSMEHLFMATSSSNPLVYKWMFNGQKIAVSDKRFKDSDTNALKIDCFECKYVGTYKCIISTADQPTVSMSAKVKLESRGKYMIATLSVSFQSSTLFPCMQNLQAASVLKWMRMIFCSTSMQTVFLLKFVRFYKVWLLYYG